MAGIRAFVARAGAGNHDSIRWIKSTSFPADSQVSDSWNRLQLGNGRGNVLFPHAPTPGVGIKAVAPAETHQGDAGLVGEFGSEA